MKKDLIFVLLSTLTVTSMVIAATQANSDFGLIFNEQWSSGWESRWTIINPYPEIPGQHYPKTGIVTIVTDYWDGSGDDLYIEGQAQDCWRCDGISEVYKWFDINENTVLKTHFAGVTSLSLPWYNIQVQFSIYNEDETISKHIRYTNNNNRVPGLSSNQLYYYYVFPDTMGYDITIDENIMYWFVSLFGITDWSIYTKLRVSFRPFENYNHLGSNPKIYVDYLTIAVQTRQEAIQDLITNVDELSLSHGLKKSLTSKLEEAIHLLNKGNENGARRKLGDFVDSVTAQRGKKITNDDADALIAKAQWIIDNI